jgi:hypothetical protein
MLVYGDAERVESVAAKQADIEALLHQVVRLPGGIERHAALVAAFISASELVQGIADAGFEQRGCDARCRLHDFGLEWLMGFARAIRRSWCSNFTEELTLGCLLTSLKAFGSLASVRTKRAEGYAFYALYPENYLEAAARSGLGPRTRIIGVRSIGEGLSAIVATALEASPPVTVRPVGHPFYREVRLDPGMMAAWASFRSSTRGPACPGVRSVPSQIGLRRMVRLGKTFISFRATPVVSARRLVQVTVSDGVAQLVTASIWINFWCSHQGSAT